jgi:hypothetical protein
VSDVLRVNPDRLTAVREAYDMALNELGIQLNDLGQSGHIDTPWLGDPASEAVRVHYNNTVMAQDKPGAYRAMRLYEDELKAIRDHVAEMEKAYLAGESAITEQTPRMA